MSTALNSPERTEELRDLPRVTAENRLVYRSMIAEANAILDALEPTNARNERSIHRNARAKNLVPVHNADGSATQLTPEYWRHEWRSLPDYEGPPMRAPSGVRWWTDTFDNPRLLLVPMWPVAGADLSDIGWRNIHLSLGAEEHINLHAAARERIGQSLYDAPSLGGRGWCPKLAGVGE